MTEEDWKEYARLLRQSLCNPTYRPWRVLVSDFEWAHQDVLFPLFGEWQHHEDEDAE